MIRQNCVLTQCKIHTALTAAPKQTELGFIFHVSPYELQPITYSYSVWTENITYVPNFPIDLLRYVRYGLTRTALWYVMICCTFLHYITLREGRKQALDFLGLQRTSVIYAHIKNYSKTQQHNWLNKCQQVRNASGITTVGVTWCGKWWCHSFFTLKGKDFF